MTFVTFKGEKVSLKNNLPQKGSHITEFFFTLQNLSDKSVREFGGPLILWFVPSLDTGVCITSAKKLNDHLKKHKNAKALILSMDLPFAQNRVCGLEHLDHVITASFFRNHESLEKLGLMIEDGPLTGLSARACMLLDTHQHISYIEVCSEITSEVDYSQLYHALEKL